MKRLLGVIRSAIKRLDRADTIFLRWVPPAVKRYFARLLFRILGTVASRASGSGLHLSVPPTSHYLDLLAGRHEPEVLALLERRIRAGMRVVDIGANVGWFTLHMARHVGPTGRVWAVEPAPDNLRYLLDNVERNGYEQVQVVAAAAGAERRLARLVLRDDSRRSGFYTRTRQTAGRTVEIPVLPLEEIVPAPVDLIKIDAEGADVEVLEGMGRLLEGSPDLALIVEWHPDHLEAAGRRPDELPELLAARGFELFVPQPDGTSRPLRQAPELIPGRPGGPPYVNLLALRVSREGSES